MRSIHSVLSCLGPMMLALSLAARAPGQEVVRSLGELRRSAALLYGEEKFGEALAEVERGLAVAPEDEKLRTIGAWCQLRRVELDPDHVGPAAAWFAELRAGRQLKDLDQNVILGIGRCQLELAKVCSAGDRRRLLEDAELSFTELIGREEQLQYALRDRCEVRLALGETEKATEDASAYERRVSEECKEFEAMVRATQVEGFRRELASRLAQRRRDLDGVQAMLARHRWDTGGRDEARRQVEAFLSREAPPCDQPRVAELLVTVAPRDPRVVPAHVYRLENERDATARRDAAIALGQLGEKSHAAVEALVAATVDESEVVAREAVTALGMIGPGAADAVAALEVLVRGEDEQMRQRAAAALRQIRRE